MKTTTQKFVILSALSLTLVSCGDSYHFSTTTVPGLSITPLQPESCPNGYSQVENFCVMKYEAKNVSGVPTSQADLSPWVGTYATEAKELCQSLGPKYDLISNDEWMKVANQVEMIGSNWTGGEVGSGCLFRGNNGQPMPWNECGYGSGNGSVDFGNNRNERAKFTLTSGEEIYDLAGNVSEWVDFPNAPTNCSQTEMELSDVSNDSGCGLIPSDYEAVNSTYTSAQGLGKVLGGRGGVARRGGASYSGDSAGIYSLRLERGAGNNDTDNGFRCVYRPAI